MVIGTFVFLCGCFTGIFMERIRLAYSFKIHRRFGEGRCWLVVGKTGYFGATPRAAIWLWLRCLVNKPEFLGNTTITGIKAR